jgi:hypothetical protein
LAVETKYRGQVLPKDYDTQALCNEAIAKSKEMYNWTLTEGKRTGPLTPDIQAIFPNKFITQEIDNIRNGDFALGCISYMGTKGGPYYTKFRCRNFLAPDPNKPNSPMWHVNCETTETH